MWHKPCRTFHPWCLCIKTRCLLFLCCHPERTIEQTNPMIKLHSYINSSSVFSYLLSWLHLLRAMLKRRNTLGCLDQYMCKVLRPWNSLGVWVRAEDRDHETVRPVKQSRYSWIMVVINAGPNLVVLAWTGDELSRGQAQNGVNFEFWSSIWPWRSRSITLPEQ